jgi:flagellar biosynthesis protein FlhA
VQRVLQQLLREQVSIRDMGMILEVLVEVAAGSKNLVGLVEAVRQALGRGLVHPFLDAEGGLRVLTLEPALEAELVNHFDPQRAALLLGDGAHPGVLTTDMLRRLVESVKRLTGNGSVTATPVLLCPSPARYHVRRWLEPFLSKVTVLAPAEIPAEIRVRSIGVVG